MDFLTHKYESEENHRPDPFIDMMRSIQDLLQKLTGIFKVTDEDLSEAGICLDGEGRD